MINLYFAPVAGVVVYASHKPGPVEFDPWRHSSQGIVAQLGPTLFMLQKCWPGLSGAARKAGQTRATSSLHPGKPDFEWVVACRQQG